MSEDTKTLVVPLRDAWKAAPARRAKVAMNILRAFARRHGKAPYVKISPAVAQKIWERGIRHPPRRIKVVLEKEEDTVYVRLEGEAVEEKEE
ncbi:MAG: 60S ribosomal protein L31 [Aigarchaeota archaeon]|nr:60S ribosomal protein L31 [Candidatus Pelearchaeum maunauluense]